MIYSLGEIITTFSRQTIFQEIEQSALGRQDIEGVFPLTLLKTWVGWRLQQNLEGMSHPGTVSFPLRDCYQTGMVWEEGSSTGEFIS